jgi:type I restriction enzyme, S subunit
LTTIKSPWTKCTLKDIGVFSKGSGVTKAEVKESGLPCIRYGEIYTHHKTVISRYNSYIDRTTAQSSKRIEYGDILLAGSGETKEEIGKATAFMFKEEAYAGGDIVIFKPKDSDSRFLAYLLNSQSVVTQKASAGKGDAVVHISATDLGKIEVTIPPLSEQKAIANALSDIDELVAVTARLLNKKERIFEGALQTEFSESSGATLTLVSDICEVAKGSAVKYDKDFIQGSFWFLNGGVNFSGSTEFANDSGDTVVISEGGNSCGFVNYIPRPFWCGGHAYRLLGFKGTQKYLYYALKKSENEIMNLRVGSGLPNVQKKNLSDFKTLIHQSSKKQGEVVNFLDSLTGEIDNLKAELAKYECIKQGMAHDLLTGKVRLV